MSGRSRISEDARGRFLDALAAGWSVTHAAGLAGHERRGFYRVRAAEDAFAAAGDEAVATGDEALAPDARRRGIAYDRPMFQGSYRRGDRLVLLMYVPRQESDGSWRSRAERRR